MNRFFFWPHPFTVSFVITGFGLISWPDHVELSTFAVMSKHQLPFTDSNEHDWTRVNRQKHTSVRHGFELWLQFGPFSFCPSNIRLARQIVQEKSCLYSVPLHCFPSLYVPSGPWPDSTETIRPSCTFSQARGTSRPAMLPHDALKGELISDMQSWPPIIAFQSIRLLIMLIPRMFPTHWQSKIRLRMGKQGYSVTNQPKNRLHCRAWAKKAGIFKKPAKSHTKY